MAAVLVAVMVSCKEKEDERTSMDGALYMDSDIPEYVMAGESYSFKAGGVTAPDGTAVGYYFTRPITSVKDTLKSEKDTFVYEIPDTLGTFSVTCTAYPVESSDKYYSSSAYITFTIVSDDPVNGSITNIAEHPGDENVELDGRPYKASAAGSLTWLRSNLCTIRRDSSNKEIFGHSFQNSPAMQNILGAYYTWEEAQTACPDGWHLPSDAEWVDLLKSVGAPQDLQPFQDSPSGAGKLMVKACFNGSVMWDYYRNVNIQDAVLSAIPAGYATINDGVYRFSGMKEYAMFWTSDERDGMGVYRYIFEQNDNVYVASADKRTFAASVRCVK